MGRPVVHWELMSKEPEKVSAFYEKIFGMGSFSLFTDPEGRMIGLWKTGEMKK